MDRCINLDWLEVYLLESEQHFPMDAEFFRKRGYKVRSRVYGTPQYAEMFTIFDNSGLPRYEIRRNPYSLKENGGIFERRSCHLRLHNRECYTQEPIRALREFLFAYGYEFQNISRVDICLDFNTFDDGTKPADFLRDYMADGYHKIGLSRVHVHGAEITDEMVIVDKKGREIKGGRILKRGIEIAAHGSDGLYTKVFNSLKWGSPSSAISTKIYDKSLELNSQTEKFYIRDAWKECGLVDNADTHVWRIEFSLSSEIKNFVKQDTGELFYSSLSSYDSREKCLFTWYTLAAKYFRFTVKCLNRRGQPQRKDRCPEVHFFKWAKNFRAYRPIRLSEDTEPTRTDKLLVKRLEKICTAQDEEVPRWVQKTAREILPYFIQKMRMGAAAKAVEQYEQSQRERERQFYTDFMQNEVVELSNETLKRQAQEQREGAERAYFEYIRRAYNFLALRNGERPLDDYADLPF